MVLQYARRYRGSNARRKFAVVNVYMVLPYGPRLARLTNKTMMSGAMMNKVSQRTAGVIRKLAPLRFVMESTRSKVGYPPRQALTPTGLRLKAQGCRTRLPWETAASVPTPTGLRPQSSDCVERVMIQRGWI